MSGGERELGAVLDRLSRVLPERAPELWESLRPPATTAELDKLRRAVDPYELPDAVVTMLGWADGQGHGPGSLPWWPSMSCGPLLSAAGAAVHYTFLRDETEDWQWNPLWLPVAHEGWNQAGVEMTQDRPGVVVDGSFGASDFHVVAPSLAAMLDATTSMIEAGIPLDQPSDRDEFRRRAALIDAHDQWQTWPYDRIIAPEIAGWPSHWRAAIGVPPEPDAPRLPAEPIRNVVHREATQSDPATIEGFITDRVLIDVNASGNSIITLDDGTGQARILVQPDTPGAYWAGWLGRRIQVDVLAGDTADHEIEAVINADLQRRQRTPPGRYLLARQVRMGVQSA